MLFLGNVFYAIIFMMIWFFPSFVAKVRNHNNFIPIFLVNLLLSFTLIGYIVSLIWAFSDNTENGKRQKIKNPTLLLIFGSIVILSTILSSFYVNTIVIDMQKNIFLF